MPPASVPLLLEGPSSAFSLSSLFPLSFAIGFLSSTFMSVSGFCSLFLSSWYTGWLSESLFCLCFNLLISACLTLSLPAHHRSHPISPTISCPCRLLTVGLLAMLWEFSLQLPGLAQGTLLLYNIFLQSWGHWGPGWGWR